MKERPILFSGEMVRAILDGSKTQTRRPMKPQPEERTGDYAKACGDGWSWLCHSVQSMVGLDEDALPHLCPIGAPGDRLWVRETWGCTAADHPLCPDGRKPTEGDKLVYRANPADDWQWRGGPGCGDFVWRPSIHMPKWACRLWLEVTSVRVERLQGISSRDAWAEGCRCGCTKPTPICRGNAVAFSESWDAIYAKRGAGWKDDPWVWVVEFKVVQP